MIIYSKASESFLRKVKLMASQIINQEIGFKYNGKRLLINKTYYPLNFVCFEHQTILGLYDPKIFQIVINKNLMFKISDDIIKNVLRHELAHFLCHVIDGDDVKSHGPEFREKFKLYKWDTEFSKSKILVDAIIPVIERDQKILEKIEKLLKLSNSSNVHEATLATQMANQLIIKHNLDYNLGARKNEEDDDETCVMRVISFSKKNAIHDGIYHVLANFNVYPVFNQGRKGGYLEVIGPRLNVTIADYICAHLLSSIELIWAEAKSNNSNTIKGAAAKNSFVRSFFQTLDEKLKLEVKTSTNAREVLILKNELSFHVQKVYPRLRSTYQNSHKTNKDAQLLGKIAGSQFELKKGLAPSSRAKRLLSFFS